MAEAAQVRHPGGQGPDRLDVPGQLEFGHQPGDGLRVVQVTSRAAASALPRLTAAVHSAAAYR